MAPVTSTLATFTIYNRAKRIGFRLVDREDAQLESVSNYLFVCDAEKAIAAVVRAAGRPGGIRLSGDMSKVQVFAKNGRLLAESPAHTVRVSGSSIERVQALVAQAQIVDVRPNRSGASTCSVERP